jgi:putative glutamine amidotransferase
MEMALIPEIIKQDKPMMGICRGHQIINVCLGGSLYQDLDKEYKLTEVHRQPAPYDKPSHKVTVLKETPLYHIIESESMSVNSCHHQAIKDLSSKLLQMAYSPEKLVEAFYMPSHRYLVGLSMASRNDL